MICIHYFNPENRTVKVTDAEAHAAVKSGKARYVYGGFWKLTVRDLPACDAPAKDA